MRLRHHFLLTRLKLAIHHAQNVEFSEIGGEAVAYDMVRCISCGFCYFPDLFQQNVVVSQGYCTILGCPVPTPFFLQEMLLGAFEDTTTQIQYQYSFAQVIFGAEVSKQDRHFYENVTAGLKEWWDSPDTILPTINELDAMFNAHMDRVCHI
jgi:hypothetical protein